MSDIEHARELIDMAEKDLKALIGMEDAETFADEIFGFHAQQAIEKTLKAWLAFLRLEYPLTHNLSTLLAMLEQHGCDVERFQALEYYTPFAVVFRYEYAGIRLPPLDRLAVCSQVQGFIDYVKSLVGTTEASG